MNAGRLPNERMVATAEHTRTIPELLGRSRELGRLEQLVADATRGRSAAVVLVGEAGVGKTALLDALALRVQSEVVHVRGAEPGDAPAYSALAHLCAPLRPRLAALPAEQAGVLASALGWGPPVAIERFAVGAGLIALLGAAARDRGLVAIVDDAGSVDSASLEALWFAVGRLGTEGVVLVFGARPEDPVTGTLAQVERMMLSGLHQQAAEDLIRSRAGSAVAGAVAARLTAATAGNPLALTGLAKILSADQLAGRQPLPRPLPTGERLRASFGRRAAALDGQVRRAVLAVAASFGRLQVLASALARLGLAPRHLEQAREAGLIVIDEGIVDFTHPLVRSAVYHAATEEERRAVHLALADANADAGDLERRAWHLARAVAAPSEETAAVIESAARLARDRGGIVEAATAFEAAALLSTEPSRRYARWLSAGELWLLAGRVMAARAISEEVLAGDPRSEVRARAALLRGRSLLVAGSEDEGRAYLRAEAERAAAMDPTAALSMAVAASTSALRSGLVGEALGSAEAARTLAGNAEAPIPLMAEVAWLTARVAAGQGAARVALKEQLEELVSAGLLLEMPFVAVNAALALVWSSDFDGAAWLLGELERTSRANLAVGLLPAVLATRSVLDFRVSRFQQSEAAAAEALDLAIQTGETSLVPYAMAALAGAESVLGRVESCRTHCLSLLDGAARSIPLLRSAALASLGLLELGEGRPAEAVRWYELLAGSATSAPRDNPQINVWGSDMTESLIGAGQTARAGALIDQMDKAVRAVGGPRGIAPVARCRAMLADDDAEAERLFAQALRHYPARSYGQARTDLARGRRLLQTGRRDEARERLQRARDVFAELGATGWAARADEQLALLGRNPPARPDIPADLSPRELQVVTAAALGGTLSDIAGGLFLSEATVESQLRSAMAKLGVSSVEELRYLPGLAGALATMTGRADTDPPQPAPAGTQIRMLGTFEVMHGGQPLPTPSPLAAQLIKYVALNGRVPAEELVEGLWPEAAPGAGANRLRTLLNRVRQSIGGVVVRDWDWLSLAGGVQVDVDQFDEAASKALAAASAGEPIAGAQLRAALDLYAGELLPADRHLAFTVGPRELLRRRYLALIGAAVDHAVAQGDVGRAVRLLEDAIENDPLDQSNYVKAASILIDAGRRSEASIMLRRARTMLAELGLPFSSRGRELERALGLTD